ncbi:hypothetical protein ACHAP4_011753 [Fusarium culmorum]
MSLSQAVRNALADFPFVPTENFSGQIEGERPCYYCVLSVGRDIRYICIAEDNAIRIAPIIQAQELAAYRSILALIYRVMTGENYTPNEVKSNLASFMPTYSLSYTKADTLAKCLASLDGCANCIHSKEKRSSRLAELPHGFKEDIYCAIRRLVHANNSTPTVTIRTVGQGPIRYGAIPIGSSHSGRSAGDGSAASARALNTRVLISPRPVADDELPDAPLAGSIDLPKPLPARSIKSADVLLPLGPPERSSIFTESLRSSDISDLDPETIVDNSPNFKGFED